MTGQTIATVRWRALEHEGDDTCRLSRVDHGWLLVGHSRFRDADGFAALDYVVRCDARWRTLGADIAGRHGTREISLRLERNTDGWLLNGDPQPQVVGADDIDLAFTPATNLMPLRRVMEAPTPRLDTRAAWLRYPNCDLRPLDQTYDAGQSAELVSYRAEQTGYATQLCVDHSGFVTLYPGLWEGEVTHEAR
ncbi:putative glycolipid-binding domain-containing protein [Roseovarius sp. CAU 1744]|uniref:putative glycolipid-binding domain-containing protein n=1 Tax=Roseovarius sp. CAU 1744 TaxID=3140368 RepID=UPI00325C1DF6